MSPALRRLRRLLRPLRRAVSPPANLLLGMALRATGRRLGVALVYHRVGDPAGDPSRELVPNQSTESMRSQLELLRRRYRVVPAAELEAAAAGRSRFERFPVAITFDDDWAGHAEVSMPLLAEAGVSATFFLNGATLERPHAFWYDRVQEAFDVGAAESVFGAGAELHPTAARIEAMPAAERRALVVRLEELLSTPPSGGLPASAVRALRDAGHEIGFHTRTHDTLTTLGKDELRAALSEGRAELEQITGTALEAIAYPSGRTSEAVFAAAAEAGFKRGYTTLPDPVGPGGDPLRMGRVDPALHTAGSLHAALNRALLRKPRT